MFCGTVNLPAAIALLLLPVTLLEQGQRVAPAARPDAARARAQAGVEKLYDTSILHRIDVVIAPGDAQKILARTSDRVRCRFTIDGHTLDNVGVRQSGGVYHPYQPITNKPSLSVKFDDFVKGQRLFDLDKLILKNELQDLSFVSEHLTYEIFRRAGLAAPMTAHARVTINGLDSGIYLMREPIDDKFLTRNFGDAFKGGNLYEIENTRDFVYDPDYPTNHAGAKNGSDRADLVGFARAIQSTTAASFVHDLSPFVDIGRLVTYVAAEIATGHWDGLTYRNNNTYVYAHPKDGKFIFIPWGTDQALGIGNGRDMSFQQPQSALVQKMLAVPDLAARCRTEVARIRREPVWNQRILLDRLNGVASILTTAGTSGRTGADIARFNGYRSFVESIIRAGGS